MMSFSLFCQRLITTGIKAYFFLKFTLIILWNFMQHPIGFFRVKARNVPPDCLSDPTLGTHHFIKLKDVRLHYVANGEDRRPLMLFIHGFPEFWYSWRHQLREFSTNYRMVALDLRGFGDSDKPLKVKHYMLNRYVSDIKQLIQALGYVSFTLVANDFGGLIAWAFVSDHQNMVDRMILMNCPHPLLFQDFVAGSREQLWKAWYVFVFHMKRICSVYFHHCDMMGIEAMLTGDDMGLQVNKMSATELEAYKYTYSRKDSVMLALSCYRAMRIHQKVRFRNRTFDKPLLLLWGEHDAFLVNDMARGFLRFATKLDIKFIPHASHWVHMDCPDIVNAHMRTFLNEHHMP